MKLSSRYGGGSWANSFDDRYRHINWGCPLVDGNIMFALALGLGLIAGLFEFVPYVGPIVTGFLAAVLAFVDSGPFPASLHIAAGFSSNSTI
ncbi:MAG: hypothetical protein R2932_39195 [Caldilineaceae bacterium]